MTGNRQRVARACFVTGALLAGGNAVSIRFSNRELPPLWGAGLRFSLAAALLLVVMAALRRPFPRGAGPDRCAAVRRLYLLVLRYWAASRAAHAFVLIPFVTVLLSAWLDHEPLGAGLLPGGLLVVAGVYVGALRTVHPPATPGEVAPPTL